MSSMAPCCSNCRHWERSVADKTLGECRRHAPPVSRVRAGPEWVWPITRDSAFCGEHQPRGLTGGYDRLPDIGGRSVPEVTG